MRARHVHAPTSSTKAKSSAAVDKESSEEEEEHEEVDDGQPVLSKKEKLAIVDLRRYVREFSELMSEWPPRVFECK